MDIKEGRMDREIMKLEFTFDGNINDSKIEIVQKIRDRQIFRGDTKHFIFVYFSQLTVQVMPFNFQSECLPDDILTTIFEDGFDRKTIRENIAVIGGKNAIEQNDVASMVFENSSKRYQCFGNLIICKFMKGGYYPLDIDEVALTLQSVKFMPLFTGIEFRAIA